MTWDATAYLVTIKAIATVESNHDYGAINPSDAITLGIAQWYGVRAAQLLFTIKNEQTALFNTYCPASIDAAMSSHPATDPWWNSRHVTREEGVGLRNLLTRHPVKTIQNDKLANDIMGYLSVAQAWGLSINDETLTTEFFCTIYHQSPNAASQICSNLPNKATLDNIYQAALNNDIVGDYRTRQDTCYNIIKNQDTSGLSAPTDDPVVDDVTNPDGGDGGNDPTTDGATNGGNRRRTRANHIVKQGNVLVLHNKNGSTSTFYKSGGVYIAADGSNGTRYTNPNPNPNPNPDDESNPDDGDTPTVPTDPDLPRGTAADIIAFARSKLGDFSYSQGPGRMTPEISGYTDCSAFLVYAFQKGGNVSLGGTYTGNLCTRGRLVGEGAVPQSQMNPGDLIFIRWGSAIRSNTPFDHVVLYCGSTRISMGYTPGPNEGPWNVDYSALNNGGRIQVRRYL